MDTKISKNLIEELYRLTSIVVSDGISKALEFISSDKYISRYYKFPKRDNDFPNGLPSFSNMVYSDAPVDYKSVFATATEQKDKILYRSISDYEQLKKFLVINNELAVKMGITSMEDTSEFKEYQFNLFIGSLVDRYLQIHNKSGFNEAKFKDIFFEKCKRYFADNLYVDIAVPILMVDFEEDKFDISENVSIIKMSNEIQLARIDVNALGSGVHRNVLGCATHMVVFKNHNIKNEFYKSLYDIVYKVNAYPLDIIDSFFASLRLVAGVDTGYSQLLCIPHNWADEYKAFLPPVYGTCVRAYPQYFDNYMWLNKAHFITTEQLKNITKTYDELLNSEAQKLQIAIKRFNSCYLRDNKEDSILDAMIALEILLSNDDKGELTYKISSRMAAIVTIGNYSKYTPMDIYKSMSTIYHYRSDIVHGRKPKKSTELIAIETASIPAIRLAIDYLRITIKTLLEYPEFFDARKIDKYIVEALDNIPK